MQVDIFTDGACLGNPGKGGWAALLRYGTVEKVLQGHAPDTTNNRMELTAVIEALQALKRRSIVTIHTDSQYVCHGVQTWLPQWRARGWKTADRKPVKNIDLWQALTPLLDKHQLTWQWVRGHNGHPENERVDKLARAAAAGHAS